MFLGKSKVRRSNFSLIELLIVIAIMGTLAFLIIPAFSDSESQAKDTVCDYNNAGTLRYVTMFHAANSVYPSGMHTGADTATATLDTATDGSVGKSMAAITAYNFGTQSTPVAIADYQESLKAAGIVHLAYGKNPAEDLTDTTKAPTHIFAVDATKDWTEDVDAEGNPVTSGATPLTLKGIALSKWAEAGSAYNATDDEHRRIRKTNEDDFAVVPLFAASTMDWEDAYLPGGPQTSKVSVAMEGKCPWIDAGGFRYYICFFKVYKNSDKPAKLLGTACPECGVLDADSF